ncbi:nucleotide-binding protein [Pinisolibacter sp.]|uniref:nucleotide-binding protein n=1 Tax=Pinisolibacter sp. TaxID=2172024 RepID=UPI002FDE673A
MCAAKASKNKTEKRPDKNGKKAPEKAKKSAPASVAASPKTDGSRFVVVGNLKGGSGKSTVVFNLAVWLAGQGHPVRLVDLDPQKTLSDLVAVRNELGWEPFLEPPLDSTDLPSFGAGSWTLVDVGAADMAGMLEAVGYADLVLVPVMPGQADIWATQRYLKIIDRERPDHCAIRLFVNRADAGAASRETREAVVALEAISGMLASVAVLPARLGRRIAFCRSLSEGSAVFELEPKSKASEEFQALAQAIVEPRRGRNRKT